MVVAEIDQHLGQVQLLERRYVTGNVPEDRADARNLAKDVDAESTAFLADVGKIEVVTLLEAVDLLLGQNFADIGLELIVGELAKLDRHQVAVHAQHRRYADGEVYI